MLVKRKALLLVLILALFSSTVAIALLANEGEADPFPPPTTEITIENPQNRSYDRNTITLNFSASSISFFSHLHFYYSIDAGQKRIPIENVTIVSDAFYQFLPTNPGIYMKTVTGNCVLGNLSQGWHNVTVYEISHLNDDPRNEAIVYSASAHFEIAVPPEPQQPELFPTAYSMGIVALMTITLLGSIVYILKRKQNA
jgi:hypothetical protein